LEGRNGEIWRRWCSGTTQEALAQEFDLSQSRVSEIIAAVRASIPPTDLDEARQKHVDMLNELTEMAVQIARKPARQKYSAGRPMFDADGSPILDEADKLVALKTATAIAERGAKLLGLDAPAKVDVGISEQAASAAAQAAGDALSRLHGE
jgi:hypothetical protein